MNSIALKQATYSQEEGMVSSTVDLKQSLARIDTLPAMPVIAQKMLALSLDTDEGESELLKLIAQDPQISARIVGLSNSSLYSIPGAITSVKDAAMCLGLTQVKSVAIGMATISALAKPPEGKLKSSDLWAHSMAIAMAMRVIAKRMPARRRPSDDQIFLAGLLHDIGYNALNFIAKDVCDVLYEKLSTASESTLLNIEHTLLGTDHGEIGARLGEHWGLPSEIIEVIRYHHQPAVANTASDSLLIKLMNIAEKILPDFSIAEYTEQAVTEQEWTDLGIDPDEAGTITEEIDTISAQAKQIAGAA